MCPNSKLTLELCQDATLLVASDYHDEHYLSTGTIFPMTSSAGDLCSKTRSALLVCCVAFVCKIIKLTQTSGNQEQAITICLHSVNEIEWPEMRATT